MQSGLLAALLNTRGLTELVILTVGLQLGVLDRELYGLLVVMALLTTVMTGPLLRLLGRRRGGPTALGDFDHPAERPRRTRATPATARKD